MAKNHLVPISFALTPRMQSFVEMRDALHCLAQSIEDNAPYAWLPAAKDVHDLLLGGGNKKPAIPNIISLFGSIRKHYLGLSKKYPEFQSKLRQACNDVDSYAETIHQQVPLAIDFLSSDAWLNAYTETIRTQDLLNHKLALPQLINPLWSGDGHHAKHLQCILEPLQQAIVHINQMLHTHVPWEQHTAKRGFDQINLQAQDEVGLIIIGLSQSIIADGIIPSCSGFRSTIRIRFSQWKPGEAAQDLKHDQTYSLMMVPFL